MKPNCHSRTDEMFPRMGELQRAWRERSRALIETLCVPCEYRTECRNIGATEPFGIWGGTTENERGFTYGGTKVRVRKK